MTREIREGSKAADADRQSWRTPRALARAIVDRFDIVLDAAATYENAVCDRFIGPPDLVERPEGPGLLVAHDGTTTPWWPLVPDGRGVFCNPPFSSFSSFAVRAIEAAARGRTAVLLGPISIDAQWFASLVDAGAEVLAFRGRIAFQPPWQICSCLNLNDDPCEHATECRYRVAAKHGPTFPSALYVLHAGERGRPRGALIPFRAVDRSLAVL